jgi:hypothetical protein
MPEIVQFTHPGAEHASDSTDGGHKSWNKGPHRRKFMRTIGDYVDGRNCLTHDVSLLFWGEWEPPSDVTSLGKPSDLWHPRWLHDPYLPNQIQSRRSNSQDDCTCLGGCGKGGNETSYQNTDPFVFDGSFKYFICKQSKKEYSQTTRLAKLERGSMILFGSTFGTDRAKAFFQLDTVFIVADWIEYNPSDLRSLRSHQEVSRMYDQVVVSKVSLPVSNKVTKLRLYRGATFVHPVNNMYSFSPARICAASPVGFPRVRLATKPFLTNNLNSSPKSTSLSLDEIQQAWMDVRNESRAQGCVEGVRFTLHNQLDRSRGSEATPSAPLGVSVAP